MQEPLFFVADAHEGPVWVADQCRLYFTTKTHLDGRRRVDIEMLDFSHFNVCNSEELWDKLNEDAAMELHPRLFYHDARMANAMCLGENGRSLIVAEQGDEDRPSTLSRINLADLSRAVIAENYEGQPFNSLNKVILTKRGHLIFSDPDYGFRQNFRPAPSLEPMLFVRTKAGNTSSFRCGLEMPHGLALSPDEKNLFVTDTSNDGAHDDDVELDRRKSVWKYAFEPETGEISGKGSCCFSVEKGVPDGMVSTADRILVGAGDGIYVANLNGELVGKIPTEETVVNLTLAGKDQHVFATVDKGVLLFKDWQSFVQPV